MACSNSSASAVDRHPNARAECRQSFGAVAPFQVMNVGGACSSLLGASSSIPQRRCPMCSWQGDCNQGNQNGKWKHRFISGYLIRTDSYRGRVWQAQVQVDRKDSGFNTLPGFAVAMRRACDSFPRPGRVILMEDKQSRIPKLKRNADGREPNFTSRLGMVWLILALVLAACS